jgi:AcrR family transcriptional regulator
VFPTHRGRRTQAAIDNAARAVIARKGILATTIADIAAEAGRSAASFYNNGPCASVTRPTSARSW